MKYFNNFLKLKYFLFSLVLVGCSSTHDTPSSLNTGGMTSGGWGTTGQSIYATCSATVTHAATQNDLKLSTAKIAQSNVGHALWYYIVLGDSRQILDTVQLEGPFHTSTAPLMLDGRPYRVSTPLSISGRDPTNVEFSGTVTLSSTDNQNISGALTWQRNGQRTATGVRLNCKKSPANPENKQLPKKIQCKEIDSSRATFENPLVISATKNADQTYTMLAAKGTQEPKTFANVAVSARTDPFNLDIRQPNFSFFPKDAAGNEPFRLFVWDYRDHKNIRGRLTYSVKNSADSVALAMSCESEF